MKAKITKIWLSFFVFFTLAFSVIGSAYSAESSGVSLAGDTRQKIFELNTKSKATYAADAEPFLICQNQVLQSLAVASDLTQYKDVLSYFNLSDCKFSPVAVFVGEYIGDLSSLMFEVIMLIMLVSLMFGIALIMMGHASDLFFRMILLAGILIIFEFGIKPLAYWGILKSEAYSTASNVNFVVSINNSNLKYSVSAHNDIFQDTVEAETLIKAKIAQLRTAPAKLLVNRNEDSIAYTTPSNAAKYVYEYTRYNTETEEESLYISSPKISQQLRENWPSGRMPVSTSLVSKTNDGWFSSDKENHKSVLLSYSFGVNPNSDIGNDMTDVNSNVTKRILAEAAASVPKSTLLALYQDVYSKVRPSVLAGTEDYKKIDFSYIAKNATTEQLEALKTISAKFKEEYSDIDYVAGISAAMAMNASSQKGAAGEITSLFNNSTFEKSAIGGLDFLCSNKSKKYIELNRQTIAKLNSYSNNFKNFSDDFYAECVIIGNGSFTSLGYYQSEAEKIKNAAADMNSSKIALNIIFNSINKAQADAAYSLNLINETSNTVKQLRIAAIGTAAAPASSKYLAGNMNSAAQIIESSIGDNFNISSKAIDYLSLFDEDAVFGDASEDLTEKEEDYRNNIRKIMGKPNIDLFFGKSNMSSVSNINAAANSQSESIMSRITNRFNNMIYGGFPDIIRFGIGLNKDEDIYEGSVACLKNLGCANETPTIYEYSIFSGKQMASKGFMCLATIATINTAFETVNFEKLAQKFGGIGKKLSPLASFGGFIVKGAIAVVKIAADMFYLPCMGMFTMGVTQGYVVPALVDISFFGVIGTIVVLFALFTSITMKLMFLLDIFDDKFRNTKDGFKKLVGLILSFSVLTFVFKITVGFLSIPSSTILIPLVIMGGGQMTMGISMLVFIFGISIAIFFIVKEFYSVGTRVLPEFLRAFEIGSDKLFKDQGLFDKTNQQIASMGATTAVVKSIETGTKEAADKLYKPIQKAYEEKFGEKKQNLDALKKARDEVTKSEVEFKDLGKGQQPDKPN
jgi:hypothetical protein